MFDIVTNDNSLETDLILADYAMLMLRVILGILLSILSVINFLGGVTQ